MVRLDTRGLLVGLAVLSLGAIVVLAVGGCVVTDYLETLHYTDTQCEGVILESAVESGIVYSHAWAVVRFGNKNQTVHLFYPPLNRWMLGAKRQADCAAWLNDLEDAQTTACAVADPTATQTVGVTAPFEAGGWIAGVAVSAVWLLVMNAFGVYLLIDYCRRGRRPDQHPIVHDLAMLTVKR